MQSNAEILAAAREQIRHEIALGLRQSDGNPWPSGEMYPIKEATAETMTTSHSLGSLSHHERRGAWIPKGRLPDGWIIDEDGIIRDTNDMDADY